MILGVCCGIRILLEKGHGPQLLAGISSGTKHVTQVNPVIISVHDRRGVRSGDGSCHDMQVDFRDLILASACLDQNDAVWTITPVNRGPVFHDRDALYILDVNVQQRILEMTFVNGLHFIAIVYDHPIDNIKGLSISQQGVVPPDEHGRPHTGKPWTADGADMPTQFALDEFISGNGLWECKVVDCFNGRHCCRIASFATHKFLCGVIRTEDIRV